MLKFRNTMAFFVIPLLCVLLGSSVAYAASNPYPTNQDVDNDGLYEVPCTRFAWQQVYDNKGIELPAWGDAGNWLSNARNSGYSTGSTPKAGAIAVWTGGVKNYGHVAYVVSGSGNTFTVNEGGRTDLDQTSSHGIAYNYTLTNAVGSPRPYDSSLTLSGFIYPGESAVISYSNISIEKRAFQVGENVTFTMSSDAASYYWVGINDANGNRIDTHETGSGVSTYTRSFSTPGIYSCYASAVNSNGYLDSNVIYFTVYDKKPGTSKITTDHYSYQVGEEVTFTMSSDTAVSYWVGINDANGNRVDTHNTELNETTYQRSFTTPGRYCCYASAVNDCGYTDSEPVYFVVYDEKPKTSEISTDKKSYRVGEEVTFTMSSDTATCYWVGINDAESNRVDTYNTAIDETTYRRSFTTPGRYCCYASAVNNCGYTESELVYFDVYDQKPTNAAISAGKTHIGINDTVDFTFDADQPCEFVLHIEKDGQEFDTVPASDNSLSYSFTDEGAYVVWVEASNPIGSCASNAVLINVLPDADASTFILPAALSAIEESAFEGSTAYVVYIPEGCASIGSYAFKDCGNLREIHIPTSCDISDTAFDGCGTIYVFGESGSSIENYCQSHNNCIFMEEE